MHRLTRGAVHIRSLRSMLVAVIVGSLVRVVSQPNLTEDPQWPPLWISGPPAPDSGRSLRRATYPQRLLHHSVGHNPDRARACEQPETLDVPISQWSQSELARQAVARGIVESISHGSVGRFLKKRPNSSRIATVTG